MKFITCRTTTMVMKRRKVSPIFINEIAILKLPSKKGGGERSAKKRRKRRKREQQPRV